MFRHIKLWEISPEVLNQLNLPGLLPLLPLTQGGDQHEVVEDMVRRLRQTGRKDLLAIGCSFAALRFKQESDQQWLWEVIKRMEDNIEDNWFLQEWMQKGMAKGKAQGLEEGVAKGIEQGVAKGLEQGSLKELRNMLIHVTTLRFPDLVDQMQEMAKQSESQEQLRGIIDKLITARTTQEAQAALMS